MKASKTLVLIASLSLAVPQAWPAADPMVRLTGHVPPQVQSATLMGRAQANELVQLSLAVRLDQNLLDQTLAEIYGRNAPAKKHYLSSDEFAEKFDLVRKRQMIKDFAAANGLVVDPAEDRPESMLVKVSGPASSIEKAFNVQLNHYQGSDGKVFRAHATEPMIPASLVPHLGAVVGLSNITGIYHPHLQMMSPGAKPNFSGATGPGGTLAPADIKTIYGLSSLALSGAGQTVALLELDGYSPGDISIYTAAFGLPSTPVTFVSVDSTANLCGAAQNQACNSATLAGDPNMVEVALDIDMVLALASGVSNVLVYTDINSNLGVIDILAKMAADNTAKVISTSWGIHELASPADDATESTIFQQMAAQGQTVYAASGDSGAFDDGSTVSVDDPASQPFVTGVGGTSLAGSSVSSPAEKAWNSCGSGKCLQTSGGSSGGGVSAVWPISGSNYNYQVGIPGEASQTNRNVPDVSLNGDPASGYAVAVGGGFLGGAIGGTSAAAPLWAGFTALLNQGSAIAGASPLGFANPTLYQLDNNASTYAVNFNDATSGDNGNYSAHAGYDNVTGLGSFKGSALINSLTNVLALLAQQHALETLINVYAFPNPWDTRKDAARQVVIANVPDDATIKLFTLSGFWVKNLVPANNRAVWDLTNDSGDRVASGLYFYTVNTPSAKTKGTIAIIK